MSRIDLIYQDSRYQNTYNALILAEQDRLFCRHNLQHFLDVARIMCILNQEEGLSFSKDLIYAAALLHDLGKEAQYRDGTDHAQASTHLARGILPDCGFTEEEISLIIPAIAAHRKKKHVAACETEEQRLFAGLLYRADKLSRACYACPAEKECDWPESKKNLEIRY